MREVNVSSVTDAVDRLCRSANEVLGEDVLAALRAAREREESPAGREVIEQLLENARIARAEGEPMCQDTGLAVVFLEVGQDVHLAGGDIEAAVNEGVRRGYVGGFLRKSAVQDPIDRRNTGDNTPAIIHTRIVAGDRVRVVVAPKGGGAENMSALRMLTPADGRAGVKAFIVDTVRRAGPNPCPPIVVGVGLGGTFEKAALLAKEALLRPIGQYSPDPATADLERELLTEINRLGIGPQGFGGRVTALWVSVLTYACHIASLPVAVNINCHAHRHVEAVL